MKFRVLEPEEMAQSIDLATLPGRHQYLYREYCRAVIFTGAGQIGIDHAPLCLLFFVRRLHPEIPVGLCKECKRDFLIWVGIFTLLPFIGLIIFMIFG